MNALFSIAEMLPIILVVAVLSSCTTGQGGQHKQHHPAAASSRMPDAASGSDQMTMNMTAMCDMHRKMMSANKPEERMALMDERMKSMSPEMMQKHMDMMREKCK